MVQSVELLLDDRLDGYVRAQWKSLRAAGVDSQERVRAESNRPHVTLFVAETIPPDVEEAAREAVSSIELPMLLGGVILFGGRHATVARLVVPSVPLLELHARLFASFSQCPGIPAHIRPGEWTPHVTLARRVPADRVGAAVIAAHRTPGDPAGTAGRIRRWDGTAKQEWRLC
ncbi:MULTISPECIES: 2'-5' RNA ligase family protein [unclassified Rhodococcus (in: high G+C Gram-positive bacteria)]|uniref:2'-5' RNA ligase family protein n=1 Tax=Rhodococcus sp. SJ-3 TaxID=3454628 RepID=UPI002D9EBA98|nr:2'-5' RNA ligase family protein [Rhodococcus sp. (in: high G+C Gram-positive bacteria)]